MAMKPTSDPAPRRLQLAFLTFLAALISIKAAEQSSPAPAHYNLSADRVAVQGYDPVSYFTGDRPFKGQKEVATEYGGVIYRFSSEKNKQLFVASPEKSLPAYGGWCATAMAEGEKVQVEPTNFKITNGRLFLFFKAFYANALKDWNKDEANLTTKADTQWKRIAGGPRH